MDTAANHYAQARALLEQGELSPAEAELARAEALDRHYPGVPTGRALLAMQQGDFFRAQQQVELALHQDADFADAHIARGRIVARRAQGGRAQGDAWLADALRSFRQALRCSPDNPEALYYQGVACVQALHFEEGREALSRVVALNRGEWVPRAMEEMARVQAVERAAPGSRAGQEIGLSPQLTRAELAVLLVEELRIGELVRKRGLATRPQVFQPADAADAAGPALPHDVALSWAGPWIQQVLALGVAGLESFTDGTFQPDSTVSRASYAVVNQGLLVLLSGDPALATRYVGQESGFPDVRSDSYAYNAIALSTERGIMQADRRTGCFRPADPVSGAEALLMMRELQNAFRTEF